MSIEEGEEEECEMTFDPPIDEKEDAIERKYSTWIKRDKSKTCHNVQLRWAKLSRVGTTVRKRNDSFRKEKLNHFGAKEFEFLDESSSDEDEEYGLEYLR